MDINPVRLIPNTCRNCPHVQPYDGREYGRLVLRYQCSVYLVWQEPCPAKRREHNHAAEAAEVRKGG